MDGSGRAFDEFAIIRCEEAVKRNEECLVLVKEISAVEDSIKEALDKDQYKLFMQHEKLLIKLQAKTGVLIYKQGLNDRLREIGV